MASINLQNLPKSRQFLECFIPNPGNKLVAIDFSALEPKVTAYFSRDKSLLALYGPDAPACQDVYLYTAAKIPGLGRNIIACGYDPDRPTPDAVARAKSECKQDRFIAKTLYLSGQYGAGPRKQHQGLLAAGVKVTLNEVIMFHGHFWSLYRGVKTFEAALLRMYQKNGGWIINGRGRPLPIDEKYSKDIVNRFVQSTGHDLLWRYLLFLKQELDLAKVRWYPYLIDNHDEGIIEVPNEFADITSHVMVRTMTKLNEELRWDVKLTGNPIIADNLAQIKECA